MQFSRIKIVFCLRLHSIGKQQQQQQLLAHPNMQILNVQNAPGLGNSLLMTSTGSTIGVGTYEPNPHNLSSFNASMGYTDADGHLVWISLTKIN